MFLFYSNQEQHGTAQHVLTPPLAQGGQPEHPNMLQHCFWGSPSWD